MVLGAIVIPAHVEEQALATIQAVLERRSMFGELKWVKVSKAKLPVYQEVARSFFEFAAANGIEFHAMVVNCYQLDHNAYNEGDSELGFNKFVFNLLHHRVGRRFGSDERVLVYLDAKNCTREPSELQEILNSAARRAHGELGREPFSKISFRDSRIHDFCR